MTDRELLPCPFCGSGKTEIRENGRPWLGTRWGEPVSVSVRHWCEPVDGQPSRVIERVGRDRAAAVAAWNMRTTGRDLAGINAIIGKHFKLPGNAWRAHVAIAEVLRAQPTASAEPPHRRPHNA